MGAKGLCALATLSLLLSLSGCHAASLSNVVGIACKRNPKLKICPGGDAGSGEEAPDADVELPKLPPLMRPVQLSASKLPGNLTRAEYLLLRQLAAHTREFKNPFSDADNVRLDQDLVEFESGEANFRGRHDSDRDGGSFVSRSESLVHAPTGEGEGQSRIDVYCDKYQENYAYYCADSDRTPSLKNHLEKFCPSYEINCPQKLSKISHSIAALPVQAPAENSETFPDVFNVGQSPEEIAAQERLDKLKKRFPCTPNCDPRIHKHCTAECKCDYIYPAVQRFCNPPPIPFFLNTCRLWYHGCPKYQQYHYASQFVYSKAEKGKTIGGQAAPKNGNYGGATTAHLGSPFGGGGALSGGFGSPVAQGELTSVVKPEKAKQVTGDKPNDPFSDTRTQFFKENNVNTKARARQVPTAGVAPADGIHAFDGYTNQNGLLYRPRSRSPFSKPGLWEPNPDDPHNRDHANKWWYHPDSVGVDWLSGQIQWGRHWAVPAAGTGGTDGFSAVHFPTIGNFFNIADDYD